MIVKNRQFHFKKMSAVDLAGLLSSAPYDKGTAAALEEHVGYQLAGTRKYDFDANKILLKNYQLNADIVNADVIANILILSLMELPNTYYLALSYLIPSKLVSSPRISTIKKCADHLERGQYREFWLEYSASADTFAPAREFPSAIRNAILSNLRDTCKSLPKETFQEFLELNSSNFNTFCDGNNFFEVYDLPLILLYHALIFVSCAVRFRKTRLFSVLLQRRRNNWKIVSESTR